MKNEKGISLIEVLVALIVLSVGLLGVASLQGLSKRANHEALQRTLATYLVDEIVERMRTNIEEFKNDDGSYITNPDDDNGYHTGTTALDGGTLDTPDKLCVSGVTCNKGELAEYDLWQWEQSIDGSTIKTDTDANVGGLVNPKACIMHDTSSATPSGKITVIITWQSLGATSDADVSGDGRDCIDDASGEGNTRQLVVNTFI